MQTSKITARPVSEVIAAIQALDLTPVKLRLIDPELGEGWSREYADGIEAAYRNFLTMVVKYQDDAEEIMLAKDVDEFWHTHILQTLKYAEDCERVFGTFLHHAPHVGEVTVEDLAKRERQADKTRALYEREFGAAVEAAWSGEVAPGKAAYSGVAAKAPDAGFFHVTVKAESAAYSGVAVTPQNAAYSGVALKAETAAYSGVAVRPVDAAYSGVAFKAEKAAYSGVAVERDTRQSAAAAHA